MIASYVTEFELASALRWQKDMGVDMVLVDTPLPEQPKPVSDFIRPKKQIPNVGQNKPKPFKSGLPTQTEMPTKSPDLPTLEALSNVNSLDDLKKALEEFEGCALKKTASNLVFSDGNPQAPIMIIGEAPGGDEDRMGLPFVGAAGQLLDKMLASIGFDRSDVYITNVLPWRPPGNRTPSSEEVEMLRPFLQRHIQIKAPQVIFALGGSSAKLLLKTTIGILKLRGRVQDVDFGTQGAELMIPVLPSLHPAYLLRAPTMKNQAFEDLLTLRRLSKK